MDTEKAELENCADAKTGSFQATGKKRRAEGGMVDMGVAEDNSPRAPAGHF